MKRVVGIKFKDAGKIYDFEVGDLNLKRGSKVIVESETGIGIGTVILVPREKDEKDLPKNIKKVIRIADSRDFDIEKSNREKEIIAFNYCKEAIKKLNLKMKLIKVEYFHDGNKVIFYFLSETRVDFRELVKELANRFHTRIELRQIGVRDEAKLKGGIGCCGRDLCCRTFLIDFQAVSIRMAKDQNLSLNPEKVSGVCGRLMCCLAYEHETYCSLKSDLPRIGKKVITPAGEGKVIDVNIITRKVYVEFDDEKRMVFDGNEVKQKGVLLH